MKKHTAKPMPSITCDADAEQFIESADLSEYDLSGFAPISFELEPKAAALMAHEQAVESWLHHQVAPAHDALKADPSRAITVEQVCARLAAAHAIAKAQAAFTGATQDFGVANDDDVQKLVDEIRYGTEK